MSRGYTPRHAQTAEEEEEEEEEEATAHFEDT